MAEIVLHGNVGQSEMKFTQGGSAYLRFSVAENHRKKSGNEWIDDGTTWWNITVWDKLAERLAEAVVKGARVVVTGTVRSREYEKDGETRTAIGVTARHVGIVPRDDARPTQQQPATDPWSTGAADAEPPF